LGGPYIAVGGLVISLIGLHEFYSAFKNHSISPTPWIGYLSIVPLYGFAWYINNSFAMSLSIAVLIMALLLEYLFNQNKKLEDTSMTLLGVFYIAFNLFHIVKIASFDSHFFIWYVFILAWGTDTCAYFTGYFFGKRKLWEEISPKKTIEGAIGGIVGATILAFGFAYVLKPSFMYYAIPLGIIGSIVSQMGDLIASKIKRYVDIKDYGHIMPGHGGVLDRFDSIILTAPLVYYYVVIVTEYL